MFEHLCVTQLKKRLDSLELYQPETVDNASFKHRFFTKVHTEMSGSCVLCLGYHLNMTKSWYEKKENYTETMKAMKCMIFRCSQSSSSSSCSSSSSSLVSAAFFPLPAFSFFGKCFLNELFASFASLVIW